MSFLLGLIIAYFVYIRIIISNELIIHDEMEHTFFWNSKSFNVMSTNINCRTTNCVAITQYVTISRQYSITSFYKSIIIQFYFSVSNNLGCIGGSNDRCDIFYVFYSCEGHLYLLQRFGHWEVGITYPNGMFQYNLSNECDNKQVTLYFHANTDTDNTELGYIDDIFLYGTMSTNPVPSIYSQIYYKELIDFNGITTTGAVNLRTDGRYCIPNNCMAMRQNSEIEININVAGYNNIGIYWDVNISPNLILLNNDYFRVQYSCDNGNSFITAKEYNAGTSLFSKRVASLYFVGENVRLISQCTGNVILRFVFGNNNGRYAYLNNIYALGVPISNSPTNNPTINPTIKPTNGPSVSPTQKPTQTPTLLPTKIPTNLPTINPTVSPTVTPTKMPSISPSDTPTTSPTMNPSQTPSNNPTQFPTNNPTNVPTMLSQITTTVAHVSTVDPTNNPSTSPVNVPTNSQTRTPTTSPSQSPTASPTDMPTSFPSNNPTLSPTVYNYYVNFTGNYTTNTETPQTNEPSIEPTSEPTLKPSLQPTIEPTLEPTGSPSMIPTISPSLNPSKASEIVVISGMFLNIIPLHINISFLTDNTRIYIYLENIFVGLRILQFKETHVYSFMAVYSIIISLILIRILYFSCKRHSLKKSKLNQHVISIAKNNHMLTQSDGLPTDVTGRTATTSIHIHENPLYIS